MSPRWNAPRQRSKTEIISSILRSIGNRTGAKISLIMYETYIPCNQLKRVFDYNGLIRTNYIYQRYGMHVVKHEEMDKLLICNQTK